MSTRIARAVRGKAVGFRAGRYRLALSHDWAALQRRETTETQCGDVTEWVTLKQYKRPLTEFWTREFLLPGR